VDGDPERARTWQRLAIGVAAAATVVTVFSAVVLRNTSNDTPDLLKFIGRFHTLVLHLPIGVLLLVATLEGLALHPRLKPRLDPAISLILPVLVLSGVTAFVLGLLLAHSGGYPPNLVALHRNFTLAGIVASAAALVAWVFADGRPALRQVYRGVLAATVGLITYGAHHGGSMTRGDGYLTRYAPAFVRDLVGDKPKPSTDDVAEPPGEEPLVFKDVILPIVKSRCVECHGPETVKGGLRLDDFAGIMKGGENGPAIVAGAAAKSPFVTRLELPLNHDDHMPPADKPQVTSEEIELFKFWIDRGASETLRVRDTLPPDGAKTILLRAVALPNGVGVGDPVKHGQPAVSGSAEPSAEASSSTSSEPTVSEPVAVGNGDGTVYGDFVAPIMEARCVRCHGPAKSKGRLRVDSIDGMLSGGKAGPAIVANDAGGSRSILAMRSSLDDKEHMPPKKEAQPTATEVEILAWWIDHGAKADTPVSALDAKLLSSFVKPAATATATIEPVATNTQTAVVTPTAEADLGSLPAEIALYGDVVKPVLAAKCGNCHEGNGASAGFRTNDLAALLDKSAPEPGIVAGKPEKSLLLKRIKLPLKHDEHMPPIDEPQLLAGDIEILTLWVKGGADKDALVAAADLSHAGRVSAKAALELSASQAAGSASASASASATGSSSGQGSLTPVGSASATTSATASATAAASPETASPPGAAGCASCTLSRSDDPADFGAVWLAGFAIVAALRRRAKLVRTQ
jgi:MYXO-CTERM domain-containing protein